MVAHNNQLPNQHFRKGWERYVKTWFDQPGRKRSRRVARIKKAASIAPRPMDGLLRPAVQCQTVKYNMKVRKGRGFSLSELKEAGVKRKEARALGIAVDHRRRNLSLEGLRRNVERLAQYKSKLVVLTKKNKDVSASQLKRNSHLFSVPANVPAPTQMVPMGSAPAVGAFRRLRLSASAARYKGIREARIKAAEEASGSW